MPFKRPPKSKADEFIEEVVPGGIEKTPSDKTSLSYHTQQQPLPDQQEGYPWERADAKIIKGLNLRFSEPDFEKVKWVFEQETDKSLQKFIMRLVMGYVDAKVNELAAD